MLRSAWSLTRLDGGFRNNVIPSTGTAVFNTRVLPGDDVLAVVEAMAAAADEPAVRLRLDGEPREPPPASPVDTALYLAMTRAAAEMAPDAVVIPFLSTGGTDGAALRRIGIPTYGILPIPLRLEDELAMHGDDERAPVAGLGWAAEYVWRTLRALRTLGPEEQRYVATVEDSALYVDPHICTVCRYRADDMLWRCPHCHEWNTLVEERVGPAAGQR